MPRLDDDGRAVTLDLHGLTVDEALDLAVRTAREAARRGRSQLKLIHGSSTSRRRYRNRTIKHALRDLLDDGELDGLITNALRADGHLLCSLDVTTMRRDGTPIQLRDVW